MLVKTDVEIPEALEVLELVEECSDKDKRMSEVWPGSRSRRRNKRGSVPL